MRVDQAQAEMRRAQNLRNWEEANGMNGFTHTGAPKKKREVGDRRPQETVRAVGSVFETPQLPPWRLPNVPARALSVEAVMDLAAEILWPELDHEQPLESHGSTMVEVRNRKET
jgi:hypothetical protein